MRSRISCQQQGSNWRPPRLITRLLMVTRAKSMKACNTVPLQSVAPKPSFLVGCEATKFNSDRPLNKFMMFTASVPQNICLILSLSVSFLLVSIFDFFCIFLYRSLLLHVCVCLCVSLRTVEVKRKAVQRIEEQLMKLQVQATDREENKQIALGTSKLNYLDPRISVAWYLCDTTTDVYQHFSAILFDYSQKMGTYMSQRSTFFK